MTKFNPREHTGLWIYDSGLSTEEIEKALEPAYAVLESAGVTPEEAREELLALLEANDQEAIRNSVWMRAWYAMPADLRPGADMALG